jgi:hypothetical protein
VVAVVGHADSSSMKGKGTRSRTSALSGPCRAVKKGARQKYNFDPNKFSVEGKGKLDEPANADDPIEQALNRRGDLRSTRRNRSDHGRTAGGPGACEEPGRPPPPHGLPADTRRAAGLDRAGCSGCSW